MLVFKTNKKEDLLQGRKISYLANKMGYSNVHLTNVLNGKKACSKRFAEHLLNCANVDIIVQNYFKELK